MSFVKIWVHLVFATKNREPLLSKNFRHDLCNHIIQNCKEKEIFLQTINGYTDHIHCLISLGRDQNISKVSQLIKGESSFWINQNNPVEGKFSWQDDYFAVSEVNLKLKPLPTTLKIKSNIIQRNHSMMKFKNL
jgi:putative transposase